VLATEKQPLLWDRRSDGGEKWIFLPLMNAPLLNDFGLLVLHSFKIPTNRLGLLKKRWICLNWKIFLLWGAGGVIRMCWRSADEFFLSFLLAVKVSFFFYGVAVLMTIFLSNDVFITRGELGWEFLASETVEVRKKSASHISIVVFRLLQSST